MMRLGSAILRGIKGLGADAVAGSWTKTRLRLFSLRPMMK